MPGFSYSGKMMRDLLIFSFQTSDGHLIPYTESLYMMFHVRELGFCGNPFKAILNTDTVYDFYAHGALSCLEKYV